MVRVEKTVGDQYARKPSLRVLKGRWTFENQGTTGRRVFEFKPAGVQHQAVGGRLWRVKRIADDGMTQGLQMHAQLMRSTGDRLEQQSTEVVAAL